MEGRNQEREIEHLENLGGGEEDAKVQNEKEQEQEQFQKLGNPRKVQALLTQNNRNVGERERERVAKI